MPRAIPERKIHIDVEAERSRFLKNALCHRRFSRDTYTTTAGIDQRTNVVFNTFVRSLPGHGALSQQVKDAEMRQLSLVVRREVVNPLLDTPSETSSSQTCFDEWHRKAVETVKAMCPVRWNEGSALTVGMAQKIINLHCKSLWALSLVPERSYVHYHATIDRITLKLLRDRSSWTQWDLYEDYMARQERLRLMVHRYDTYPLALECWHWNRSSKRMNKDRK